MNEEVHDEKAKAALSGRASVPNIATLPLVRMKEFVGVN